MARRYSDIKRGQRLADALTNYTNHLTNPPAPDVGSQGQRDLSQDIYILPFLKDLPATTVVRARCSLASKDRLYTLVSAVTECSCDEVIGSNSLASISKFSPARVVLFENATYTAAAATSDVTGQRYLKYTGDRYSIPFGKGADTDDEYDAYAAVKAAVLADRDTQEIYRVSWKRERLGL